MEMDPNNPVVKLCAQGMQAEFEGKHGDARVLFTRAWEVATDNYEACVAAHFLARHQDTPEDSLRWNQESLNRAEAVNNESVLSFYPSLYLNMGYSHEVLGNREEAKRYYDLAESRLAILPDMPYSTIVRNGVARAQERMKYDTDT